MNNQTEIQHQHCLSLKQHQSSSHLHVNICSTCELIEANRRIFASVKWAIIASVNGLSPIWLEAISCHVAELVSMGLYEHIKFKF